MIYLQAFIQNLASMGPHYIANTYKWVKMAVWDAPYRVWLDVELEKISIERNFCTHPCEHTDEKDCDENCDEEPKSE